MAIQKHGKPADPRIYIWRPPDFRTLGWRPIWSNLIIRSSKYLARESNITITNTCHSLDRRPKTPSECSICSCCLPSRQKLEAVINNARIPDICLQLDMKLNTASNCNMSSGCLSSQRSVSAVSDNTTTGNCLQL